MKKVGELIISTLVFLFFQEKLFLRYSEKSSVPKCTLKGSFRYTRAVLDRLLKFNKSWSIFLKKR